VLELAPPDSVVFDPDFGAVDPPSPLPLPGPSEDPVVLRESVLRESVLRESVT
jgi:hypothetical protein